MSSENTDIRNRRFYERKEFWIALASVAVAASYGLETGR